MTKIFYNNRIIIIAFFTIFSLASATGNAAGSNGTLKTELKYSGLAYNQPLYKLVVSGNTAEDALSIVIRDAEGNELFSENIIAESFTKTFLLNIDELTNDTFYFELTNKKTKESVVYALNQYAHLEEEMAEV